MESKTLPKLPDALRAIVEGPGWEAGWFGDPYYDYEADDWATVEVYLDDGGAWAYVVNVAASEEVSLRSLVLVTSLARRIEDALEESE